MRLVLESHSRIYCVDEHLAYASLAGLSAHPTAAEVIGYKIPVWAEQLAQPYLKANELNLQHPESVTIPNFYRDEKIVFMVRNPLDSVSSMLNLQLENGTWIRRIGIPVVRQKATALSFARAYAEDLAYVNSSDEYEVAAAAFYWKFKNASLLEYMDRGMPVCAVRYEELVSNPEPVLRRVIEFLELNWEPAVLNHHRLPHDQLFNGRAIGNTDPTRSIDARSTGVWKSQLTPAQVQAIAVLTEALERRIDSVL